MCYGFEKIVEWFGVIVYWIKIFLVGYESKKIKITFEYKTMGFYSVPSVVFCSCDCGSRIKHLVNAFFLTKFVMQQLEKPGSCTIFFL